MNFDSVSDILLKSCHICSQIYLNIHVSEQLDIFAYEKYYLQGLLIIILPVAPSDRITHCMANDTEHLHII